MPNDCRIGRHGASPLNPSSIDVEAVSQQRQWQTAALLANYVEDSKGTIKPVDPPVCLGVEKPGLRFFASQSRH